MAMVDVDDSSLPTGGLTAQVDWLGLRVGGHLALSLHSSYELGELSQWRYAMMTAPSISSLLLLLLLYDSDEHCSMDATVTFFYVE